MRTEVITITPDIAQGILTRSVKNFRRPIPDVVSKYAADMRDGLWKLNGVPLLFNCDESCIDGQHRLLACILAETPFATLAVYGVKDAAGVDEGRLRTAGQWLVYNGVAGGKDVAAITRLCMYYERGELHKRSPQPISNTAVLKYYNDRAVKLSDAARMVTHQRVIPRSVLGCIMFHAAGLFNAPSESEQLQAFVDGIRDGNNLDTGDARLLLRNRVLAVARHQELDRITMRAIVIIAWNKFVGGSKVRSIRWRTGGERAEGFPKAILNANF